VFPEISLTGSVDPATRPERLIALDDPPVRDLAAATRDTVPALFGVAERGPHITQVYAAAGEVVGAYRKRHLGEGEEAYTPGGGPALFEVGAAFGVAICAEGGVDYPFDEPAAAGAGIVFFCAAPGLYGPRRTEEAAWRAGFDWWESCGLADARRHAVRTGAWVALTTQAGATVDEDFPGIAAVVAPSGEVVARLLDWRAGTLVVDVPRRRPPRRSWTSCQPLRAIRGHQSKIGAGGPGGYMGSIQMLR
jgi:predicted amidohydrolase